MQKVTTWAGLDVHAERIVIATLTGQGREPEVRDIPNDPKVIRRTLRRLLAGAYEFRCCYEGCLDAPCSNETDQPTPPTRPRLTGRFILEFPFPDPEPVANTGRWLTFTPGGRP